MFNKPGTLAVVCLATAMLMLDIAVVNTALPQIAHDLQASLTGLQWVVDAYTLVFGAMTAYAVSYHTGYPWLGVFAAGLSGAVLLHEIDRHRQQHRQQDHVGRRRSRAKHYPPRVGQPWVKRRRRTFVY